MDANKELSDAHDLLDRLRAPGSRNMGSVRERLLQLLLANAQRDKLLPSEAELFEIYQDFK